jgi:hypothetical protein
MNEHGKGGGGGMSMGWGGGGGNEHGMGGMVTTPSPPSLPHILCKFLRLCSFPSKKTTLLCRYLPQG